MFFPKFLFTVTHYVKLSHMFLQHCTFAHVLYKLVHFFATVIFGKRSKREKERGIEEGTQEGGEGPLEKLPPSPSCSLCE